MSDADGLVGVVRRSGLGLNLGRGFVDGDGLLGSTLQCIAVSLNRRELEGTTFALGGVPGHLVEVRCLDQCAVGNGGAIDLERACSKASGFDSLGLVGRVRAFEDFLADLGIGVVVSDADGLVGLVGGRSLDRRLSRLVDGAARLTLGSTRLLLASRIRFDNGTAGPGAATVSVALVGVATSRAVLRGVGFVLAAIGAVLATFLRIASLVAALVSLLIAFLPFAAGLSLVVLNLGRAGATLLLVLSRVGGRGRRVRDGGRFGHGQGLLFGTFHLGGIGFVALHGHVGDLATHVVVAVPDQLVEVGLVDDLTVHDRLAFQGQRGLVVLDLDDEAAQLLAGEIVGLVALGQVGAIAVADDGVSVGDGTCGAVLAQPGAVVFQLAVEDFLLCSLGIVTLSFRNAFIAVIFAQRAEQFLANELGLFGVVDAQQLATACLGHLFGLSAGDRLFGLDDFVGGDGFGSGGGGSIRSLAGDLAGGLDLAEDARASLTFGRVDPDDLDELDVLAFASRLLERGGDVGQLGLAVGGNLRCLSRTLSRGRQFLLGRLLVAVLGVLAGLVSLRDVVGGFDLRAALRRLVLGARIGRRGHRVLDVGRFGQRHRAFLGVGDGLGRGGIIAVDGLIGDLAGLVQVGVPGQLGGVGLVDDLAFDHGLAVQQQRRLVAFIFDDELAERGACSFVELHGTRAVCVVAVADDGVGLGIGALSGVLAQPGTVGSQLAIQDFLLSSLVAFTSCCCFGKGLVAVILTQGAEQILVQPGLFFGGVDGHQLAAQLGGHRLGFCQSDGLASVDDFIGTAVVAVDGTSFSVLGVFGAEDAADLDVLSFATIGTSGLEEVSKLGQVGDTIRGNLRFCRSACSRGGLGEILDRGGVNLGLIGRFRIGLLGRLFFLGRFGRLGTFGRLVGAFGRLGVLGRLLGGRGSWLLAALVLSGLLVVVLGDRLAAGATAAATAGCGGHGNNAHHAGTNGQRADGGGGTGGACGTGFGNRSFTAHCAQRAFGSSGCVGGGHAPFSGGLCHHFLHGFGLFGLGHLVQLCLVSSLLGHLGGVSGGCLGGLACSGAALGGLGFCRAVLSCHIDLRTLKVSR